MIQQVGVIVKEGEGGVLGVLEEGHIAGEVGDLEGGETMLALAEEIAWAAEPEVLLGDLEAVIGFGHYLESGAGFLAVVIGDQDTVRLMRTASHAASELMELTEAEAVGILDDHDGGVRDIDADFDDGSGDEDMDIACGEGGHNFFFFPGLHPPMDAGDVQVGEDLLLEQFCVIGSGLAVVRDLVVFLDHGADDISLTSCGDIFIEEGIDPLSVAAWDGEGIDRLAAWGEFIDNGDIEVAIDHQGEGPGDRGSGHNEEMGGLTFGGECGTLCDAEAVLFIGNDESEVMVADVGADEGVGTDRDLGLAGFQSGEGGTACLHAHGACKEGRGNAQPFEERGEAVKMLFG